MRYLAGALVLLLSSGRGINAPRSFLMQQTLITTLACHEPQKLGWHLLQQGTQTSLMGQRRHHVVLQDFL